MIFVRLKSDYFSYNEDEYGRNRNTGSFILIDDGKNETVAAGMLL